MRPVDLIKALGEVSEDYVSQMLEYDAKHPEKAQARQQAQQEAQSEAERHAAESCKTQRIFPAMVALGCAAACVAVMAGIALIPRLQDGMLVQQGEAASDRVTETASAEEITASETMQAVTTAPPIETTAADAGTSAVFSYPEAFVPVVPQPEMTAEANTSPVMTIPLTTPAVTVTTEVTAQTTAAYAAEPITPEYGDVDMDGLVTFADGMLVWYDEYCRSAHADGGFLTAAQRALIVPAGTESGDHAKTITMLVLLRLWFGYPELTMEQLLADYDFYDGVVAAHEGQQLPADAMDYYAVYLRLNSALEGLRAGTVSDEEFLAEIESARETCHALAQDE